MPESGIFDLRVDYNGGAKVMVGVYRRERIITGIAAARCLDRQKRDNMLLVILNSEGDQHV